MPTPAVKTLNQYDENPAIETKICVRVREQIKRFSLIQHTEPPNPTRRAVPRKTNCHVFCRRPHGAVHHHGVQKCTIPAAPSPLVTRPNRGTDLRLVPYEIVTSQIYSTISWLTTNKKCNNPLAPPANGTICGDLSKRNSQQAHASTPPKKCHASQPFSNSCRRLRRRRHHHCRGYSGIVFSFISDIARSTREGTCWFVACGDP